jgi:hypothetical protein
MAKQSSENKILRDSWAALYHGVGNSARTITNTVRNRKTAVIEIYKIDLISVLMCNHAKRDKDNMIKCVIHSVT